jgi:Mlc titration factor MtfA (ptsG expression regulator)
MPRMGSRFSPWTRWRRRRQARRLRALHISYRFWHEGISELRACDHLDGNQRRRLRVLCGAFLAGKRCVGARRFPVDDRMRLLIAILACVPVLELGLDWLRGVREVVIYPGTFLVNREAHDEAGVVHREQREMAGEAWERGPVILSWGDFVRDAAVHGLDEGLVLHEFVHKLDMLSGEANGRPPLPRDMSGGEWEQAFASAFRALSAAVNRGEDTVLDPYGSESPAEFFSVCSEAFFLRPQTLQAHVPEVYAQLYRFYRQDPAGVFSACIGGR